MTQGRRDATVSGAQDGRRGERGAVAVEAALIMPLLIMLMLGIVTTGLSYSHSIGLTNAVREGARFGATTLTSDDTVASTWSEDVVTQVRGTQFDDASSESGICVQLWKVGTTPGSGSSLDGFCSAGTVAGLTLPATAGDAPRVPDSVPAGACVVRVVGARNFTLNIGLASWDRVTEATSVARYERGGDEYTTCA